ncbi:MAG: TetR/AcrR family transcriptional regulator [Geminicoccales bacterium]
MSAEVYRAVLDATNRMLEATRVGELTINTIAKEAGVSRPAIYRRWSTPREIALEAFLQSTSEAVTAPICDTSSEVLKAYILALTRFMRGRGGRIIAELLGEAQNDPELLTLFHERFLDSRREHGRGLIERGMESGEFDPKLDIGLMIDLYAGPIYYRALSAHAELTDDFAHELGACVCKALRR